MSVLLYVNTVRASSVSNVRAIKKGNNIAVNWLLLSRNYDNYTFWLPDQTGTSCLPVMKPTNFLFSNQC